jgi:uncharacterized paraquat-inducible protein A
MKNQKLMIDCVCGKEVSREAATCPSCGHPLKHKQSLGYNLGILVIAIILILLAVDAWMRRLG